MQALLQKAAFVLFGLAISATVGYFHQDREVSTRLAVIDARQETLQKAIDRINDRLDGKLVVLKSQQ